MPSRTHGESQTKLYRKWLLMKRSCDNENAENYKNIGGKGIKVYPEWHENYIKFKSYALEHGYQDGLVIDRKDKNKDFEPGNIIFVTRQKRQQNKEINNTITYNGKTQTVRAWANELGVSRQALYARIQRYEHPEDAIRNAFAGVRKGR